MHYPEILDNFDVSRDFKRNEKDVERKRYAVSRMPFNAPPSSKQPNKWLKQSFFLSKFSEIRYPEISYFWGEGKMTGTFAKYGGIGGSYYSTSESSLSLCIPLPLILPSSRAVYTHNYILKAGGCLLKKILFKNCSSFWSFDRYVNILLGGSHCCRGT